MHIHWDLDLGNILSIVVPVSGAMWVSVRGLYANVAKLGLAVTALQDDVSELRRAHTLAAKRHEDLRGETLALGTRLTRIETLLEVMLPGVMADPTIRSVFRDAVRTMVRSRNLDRAEPGPGAEDDE